MILLSQASYCAIIQVLIFFCTSNSLLQLFISNIIRTNCLKYI
nr:MAG TPA: hypothetical protein [Bacteriophage sp.]